jgi:hypothetical protein
LECSQVTGNKMELEKEIAELNRWQLKTHSTSSHQGTVTGLLLPQRSLQSPRCRAAPSQAVTWHGWSLLLLEKVTQVEPSFSNEIQPFHWSQKQGTDQRCMPLPQVWQAWGSRVPAFTTGVPSLRKLD